MTAKNSYPRGSEEYLAVTVTADVTLTTQPVAVSLDRGATWLDCTWQGSAGTTRTARTDDPVVWDVPLRKNDGVLVRVTDNPETPLIRAGSFAIL